MSKKTEGQILSLLHLGYSIQNRDVSMELYSEKMNAENCRTQRSEAPYLGKVNGVNDAVADLAFINYATNRPMIELLEFVNPKDILREYRPGEPAFSQIGFRTADIKACFEDFTAKGYEPLKPIQCIDYGYGKGKESFLLKDSNNMYVQIVQAEESVQGDGRIIDHDHLVLSVPNIEETIDVFRELLCFEIEIEDVSKSDYLASICDKPISRVAICKSRLEDYTVELWETEGAGDVEDIYISASGSLHLCFLCQGIDDLYEKFSNVGMRFVNEPVLVTSGANEGAKAIFFHAPGYLWIELMCRKDRL